MSFRCWNGRLERQLSTLPVTAIVPLGGKKIPKLNGSFWVVSGGACPFRIKLPVMLLLAAPLMSATAWFHEARKTFVLTSTEEPQSGLSAVETNRRSAKPEELP